MPGCPTFLYAPARSSGWWASPCKPTTMRPRATRAPAVRACASRNASTKGEPHENPQIAARRTAPSVAGRARLGRASDLRETPGARDVRAPGEAQCGTRFTRNRLGPPAAGAKLLVFARLRREGGEFQAANEPSADA